MGRYQFNLSLVKLSRLIAFTSKALLDFAEDFTISVLNEASSRDLSPLLCKIFFWSLQKKYRSAQSSNSFSRRCLSFKSICLRPFGINLGLYTEAYINFIFLCAFFYLTFSFISKGVRTYGKWLPQFSPSSVSLWTAYGFISRSISCSLFIICWIVVTVSPRHSL